MTYVIPIGGINNSPGRPIKVRNYPREMRTIRKNMVCDSRPGSTVELSAGVWQVHEIALQRQHKR